MTAAATLVYTSSQREDNAVRIARVAAAGRVQAARVAAARREAERRAHNLVIAEQVVAEWRAAGATVVGFKITLEDGGRWRPQVAIDAAAEFMASTECAYFDAWGLREDGAQAGETFGIW